MDCRPLGLPPRGSDGGLAKEPPEGGGGTGGDTRRGPGPTRTSSVTGDKDRGLADSAAIYSKWDGSGGTGMA